MVLREPTNPFNPALKSVLCWENCRVKLWLYHPGFSPEHEFTKTVPKHEVHKFTALQLACLWVLWNLKESKWGNNMTQPAHCRDPIVFERCRFGALLPTNKVADFSLESERSIQSILRTSDDILCMPYILEYLSCSFRRFLNVAFAIDSICLSVLELILSCGRSTIALPDQGTCLSWMQELHFQCSSWL